MLHSLIQESQQELVLQFSTDFVLFHYEYLIYPPSFKLFGVNHPALEIRAQAEPISSSHSVSQSVPQ